MRWSLSEFLNLLDLRNQSWSLIQMGTHSGYRIRASEAVLFHAMIEGSATISGPGDNRIALEAGDIVLIISGAAHAVRTHPGALAHAIEFLNVDDGGDMLHHVTLSGPKAARALCGCLKVRWAGGLDPHFMPPSIKMAGKESIINLQLLAEKASESGAATLLNRAAALVLTAGLRDLPQCQSIFRDANFRDPISRAIQIMELHSQYVWTVAGLAEKVGMGRSTFAGRFQAQIGRPPMEVLTDMRMRKAEWLLTQTQLKIAEIGERVGYRSESRFISRFESHFNITPGKMRARNMIELARKESGRPYPRSAGAKAVETQSRNSRADEASLTAETI